MIDTDPYDHIWPDSYDYSWAGAVDGMTGVEAWEILSPRGFWPPTLHPLLVREVVVEPGHHTYARMSLRFILA